MRYPGVRLDVFGRTISRVSYFKTSIIGQRRALIGSLFKNYIDFVFDGVMIVLIQ